MAFPQNIRTILLTLFLACTITICMAEENQEYSENEIRALKQFRERIPDIIALDEYYQKDSYLIRWLRARNLNLKAAEDMVRAGSKWRKENYIKSILNETLLEFSPLPYEYRGTDKEGRPLIFFTPATIDFRGLVLAGKYNMALRTWDQVLEKGYDYIKHNVTTLGDGKDVTQLVGILDGHGFNVRQHACFSFHKLSLPLLELLRPFLSEATQKALVVFDSNRSEWSAFLRKIIDVDQLPYRFGGEKQ